MLDQLFGSKTRVGLLRLFFDNPEDKYYVRELTRVVGAQINSVRRELNNLTILGIVSVIEDTEEEAAAEALLESVPKGLNKKKYYKLNQSFVLFEELSSLFSKSHVLHEKDFIKQLASLGQIHYLALTGFFTGVARPMTDILIVGNVNRQQLSEIIKQFEQKAGREINYTIMPLREFEYRREITDKFLYDILVNPKIVAVDTLGVN
jgi:hypothetical protein